MVPHVLYFNRTVLQITRNKPQLLEAKELFWLLGALAEEITELETAHLGEHDLAKSVDALIDLIYFAIGGLYRLGLDEMLIAECFGTVHQANLQKKLGVKPTRPQDGSVADAVKPEGFEDPVGRIRAILEAKQ